MLMVALVCQTTAALVSVRVMRGHWLPLRYEALEVVRAYVLFACWLSAWTSRQTEWRGRRFALLPGADAIPIEGGE